MNAVLKERDEITIAACPPQMLAAVWDQCIPFLEKVVARSHGEITIDSVKARLQRADSLLVVICDGTEVIGACVVEVRVMDSGLRALFIPIVGGTRMFEWMDQFLEIAKAIAKDYDCTELRGMAVRKGWMRILKAHKWEEVHQVVKCKLD